MRREASGPGTIGVLAGNYEYDEHGPRQLSQILAPDGTSIAAFDYDAAGRQTRSADRTLHYNGLDQLIRVELPEGVVEHAYGYDGLRIRTRSVDGTEQIWFSEGLSDKDGLREHTITLNSRILARVTQAPEGRTSDSAAAGASTTRWPLITLLLALASLFTMGLAWTARLRPRRSLAAARGLALTLLAGIGLSCGGGTQWHTDQILYAHAGVSPGPVLFTDDAGVVVAERRYEPFGGTLDSYRETDGQTGLIDFARIPYNALNKQSDPDTEWSYHGARWLAPQTAQWLTPDPPVKGPADKFMVAPWALHPYQYVLQNPILYWDPDGREELPLAVADRLGKTNGRHTNIAKNGNWQIIRGVRDDGSAFWLAYNHDQGSTTYFDTVDDLNSFWPTRDSFARNAYTIDNEQAVSAYLFIRAGAAGDTTNMVYHQLEFFSREFTPKKIAVGLLMTAAAVPVSRTLVSRTGSMVRHGPLNPGPLADDVAKTFRSSSYTAHTLSEPRTLYRVIGDGGRPAGGYWTETKPAGPLQSVIDSALDQNWGNTATTVITARIPAGTTIYEGAAAAQRGLGRRRQSGIHSARRPHMDHSIR